MFDDWDPVSIPGACCDGESLLIGRFFSSRAKTSCLVGHAIQLTNYSTLLYTFLHVFTENSPSLARVMRSCICYIRENCIKVTTELCVLTERIEDKIHWFSSSASKLKYLSVWQPIVMHVEELHAISRLICLSDEISQYITIKPTNQRNLTPSIALALSQINLFLSA